MSNVDSWCKACGEVELPSELQDLEDAIHHHQGIYEHITLAYSEVSVLFVSLDKIVSSLNHDSVPFVAMEVSLKTQVLSFFLNFIYWILPLLFKSEVLKFFL